MFYDEMTFRSKSMDALMNRVIQMYTCRHVSNILGNKTVINILQSNMTNWNIIIV